MSSKQWTEKQTKEVMKKVIRQAEVSRIARLLQHRLALANIKTQNGWENLTLDAIEPKIEDLRRKRQISSQEKSPEPEKTVFSDGDLEWLRRNRTPAVHGHGGDRPLSQVSNVGPLPSFRGSARKRNRGLSDLNASASKRHRSRKDSSSHGTRLIQSSPGYYEDDTQAERKFQPTFHSSPPRTPPQRMKATGRNKNAGEEGADLLLYLATSPSPATASMPKTRYIPTTPPSRSNALPSSMMNNTPGAPQTPQTGFNFADFVNITPSPAQGAFGPVGRGTPIAAARRRLNFDQLVPPSGSPPAHAGNNNARSNGMGMDLGELVS
ncbi:hypothetical protein EDC01DRAFT_140782 [Geopyxis carbonaria]|nr:hypothetical protein EDC01DRAFT_140782 [Geopyxis carbonaria]